MNIGIFEIEDENKIKSLSYSYIDHTFQVSILNKEDQSLKIANIKKI